MLVVITQIAKHLVANLDQLVKINGVQIAHVGLFLVRGSTLRCDELSILTNKEARGG